MLLLNFSISFLVAQSVLTVRSSPSGVTYPTYKWLGCFKDSFHDRALPNLYRKVKTVESCFRKALEKRYQIFAVQWGRECWLDDSEKNDYAKYGRSNKCKNGTGGGLANDVYNIISDTRANQHCAETKAQYASTRLTCRDTDLATFKAVGKLKTKQLLFNVSGIKYLVKAKINLKKLEAKVLDSIYELVIIHAKKYKTYSFNVTTVTSLDVWFNEPLAIDSKDVIVNVRLNWHEGNTTLMITVQEAIILYGIPVIRNCPNTNCLSKFITWKHLVHKSNQTVCVEDSAMLKLRFNACTAPPNITEGPKSQRVPYGTTAYLVCRVASLVHFQRRWYKDGELIKNQTEEKLEILGTLDDQGSYYCNVSSNGFEKTSQKAHVTLSNLLSSHIYLVIDKRYSEVVSEQSVSEVSHQTKSIIKSFSDYFSKGGFKWKCEFDVRNLKNASGHIGAEVLVYTNSALKDINVPQYYNEMKTFVVKGAKNNLFVSLRISPLSSIQVVSLDYCLPETTGAKSLQGQFNWNLTAVGQTADLQCPYGPIDTKAKRMCKGNSTAGGVWSNPDSRGCSYLSVTTEKLHNLSKTIVHSSNVKKVAAQLKDVTSNSQPQKMNDVDAILTAEVLDKIMAVPGALETTANDVMVTMSNVMEINATVLAKSQKSNRVSSKFVKMIDSVGENLPLNDSQPSRLLTTSNIAIQSNNIDVKSFSGLSLAVRSTTSEDQALSQDRILTEVPSVGEVQTSISLPRNLFANQKNLSGSTQVSFVVYQNTKFFQPIYEGSRSSSWSINSRIIAASARGMKIRNITSPGVEMTFFPLDSTMPGGPVCAFWDFNALGGLGNWSDEGCTFVGLDAGRVKCRCNHMTHFAVLFSVHGPEVKALEKDHIKALTIISYIGCGISLAGVTLTLLTYCLFRNLRKTNAQPILMNLCLSLMLLLVVFMAGSGQTDNRYVCYAVAVLLHYFLLTTVTWMAVEGYQMYLAFIQVLATYTRHFMLKCSIVAWGVPAIIAISTAVGAMVAGVLEDGYVNSDYCVLTGIPMYAAVFGPVLFIISINFIIYGLVLCSMKQTRALISAEKRTTSYQRVRIAVAVLVLLGLTWVFGALAIGSAKIVFEYLFCIFNSLQGFFIFVFHCLRQKDVQRQWIALLTGKGTSHSPTVSEKQAKTCVASQSSVKYGFIKGRRKNTEPSTVADSPLPTRNSALVPVFVPSSPNMYGEVHV